ALEVASGQQAADGGKAHPVAGSRVLTGTLSQRRGKHRREAAKPRGREAQPAGNSAMMDALAAAMGKKR
ncbi:hypothetical protein LAM67_23670, partial [Mycobacterium tuberculosis]|nr:hypothetical protein [Mycobacterium tuberculosis]